MGYEPISGQLGSGRLSQAVETAAQAAGGPVVLLLGKGVLFMGPEPSYKFRPGALNNNFLMDGNGDFQPLLM